MIARMKETRNIQLSEFSTVQLARLLRGKYAETTGGQGGGWRERFFRRRDVAVVTLLPLRSMVVPCRAHAITRVFPNQRSTNALLRSPRIRIRDYLEIRVT